MRITAKTCVVKRALAVIANNYLNSNMNNLLKIWNNRTIRIRSDRYVSLTDMAQATGKRFPDWNRLEGTKSYLATLSSVVQIPTTQLIDVNQGGISELQGTWGHPKLAIRFAQWCSDALAVQVDCWMDELLTTGRVELSPVPKHQLPATYLEALEALVATEKQRLLLQAQNEDLQQENEALAEAVDELFEYSSIVRIAKFNNCSEKLFNWRELKAASKLLRLEVKQVPCPRFGTKNLYSHDAWRYVYPGTRLPETTTLAIRR